MKIGEMGQNTRRNIKRKMSKNRDEKEGTRKMQKQKKNYEKLRKNQEKKKGKKEKRQNKEKKYFRLSNFVCEEK